MVAAVSAGDVVAEKYRVERLLGRGGMGYVVAARHLTLDQLVAIKFLRKSALSDEEALARFRREAKACVRLKGEHVAKVFDVGVHGEEPFIVMEHLEGSDLGALTKLPDAPAPASASGTSKGRVLPAAEACDYILQACEALAEAHAIGIVHRDIKLPNLFLTRAANGRGLLKVLDFGVSKTVTEGDVTQTAAVLGSPKYMSPEQMNDPRHVDGRTDIWSLGVCLYRLLSGYAPFDGDTIGRLCTMVLHEPHVRLSDLRPDLPPALDAVVACCLQKDRVHRFANVAELAAALAPFSSSPEASAEIVHRIALVLGLDVAPPLGYLPPEPPPAPHLLRGSTTGQSLEGAAAWAHSMVAHKREKKRSEITFALVAAGLLLALTIVGAVLVRRQEPPRAAQAGVEASVDPPLMTVTPPPTPVLISPPPPATTAATTPTVITPPTPTPTSPPAAAVAVKRGRSAPPPAKTPPSDALPIPGDRK